MSEVKFRSRIDLVLGVALAAPVLMFVYALIDGRNDGVGSSPFMIGMTVFVTALVGWIVCDTSYVITDTHLRIRSGPQRFSIPLASIRRVRRSHTLIAAPALSLRRLELDHGTSSQAVISPEREAEFLALLQERVPTLDCAGLVGRT